MSDAVGGRARLTVVTLLAGVLALQGADLATIGAMAVQLEASLGIGNVGIGLLVTVSSGVGALATLPMGLLADRVARVRLLAGAMMVWSLTMVVCGSAQSYLMLLLARVALGIVVAVATPVVASLTGDLVPAVDRGRVYGYVLAGELVGGGFGFLVCGHLAEQLSWRWGFWVLAAPSLVLAVLLPRLLPEPARGGGSQVRVGDRRIRSAAEVAADTDPASTAGLTTSKAAGLTGGGPVEAEVRRRGIVPVESRVLSQDPADRSLGWAARYVLSIPTNVLLIITSALGNCFLAGVRTFAVVYLVARYGVSSGTATTLLVVLGAGSILGVLVTGRLADALLARHHLDARVLVAAGAFAVGAVFFVPALLSASLLVAAPLLVLSAAGVGGTNPPVDAARLDLVHSRLWGRAESIRTVLRGSLEAVAPVTFGYLSTRLGSPEHGLAITAQAVSGSSVGLERAFLLSTLTLVVAAVLLLFARRTYGRDVATALASEAATRDPDPTAAGTSPGGH